MLHEPSECFVYAKPCKREHETACMMISIAHYQEAFNQLRQIGAERDDLRKRLQSRIAALEAEREKAVELLRESLRGAFESEHTRPAIQSFLASIGGEVKP